MNEVSLSRVLGDFSALLDVSESRSMMSVDADEYSYHVALYETDRDGMPVRHGSQLHTKVSFDGRLVASLTRSRGRGALVEHLVTSMRQGADLLFEQYALRRLVRKIDFALFAIDHDGGHGVDVESGIHELWRASGADTWAAYAKRREEVLRWLESATLRQSAERSDK